MASIRLNFYGVGVERLETCTQGHNKGGRAEGIMKPETLGCEGFKVLSAWWLIHPFKADWFEAGFATVMAAEFFVGCFRFNCGCRAFGAGAR